VLVICVNNVVTLENTYFKCSISVLCNMLVYCVSSLCLDNMKKLIYMHCTSNIYISSFIELNSITCTVRISFR